MTNEQKEDAIKDAMALVRTGYAQATLDIVDTMNKYNDLPNAFVDEVIEMLKADNKRKFAFDIFKKELEDLKNEH